MDINRDRAVSKLRSRYFRLLFCIVFVSVSGCANSQESEGEISLRKDVQAVDQLRKNIPPEKIKENDDLKDIVEIEGQLKFAPKIYRSRFDQKMRKKRSVHRKEVRKERERFTKNQRKVRASFKKEADKKKKEFKARKGLTRDQQKEFYKEQDLIAKDFYSKLRDERKEFDATARNKSRNFDSFYREKNKEFRQQLRIYQRRWRERESELRKKKREKSKEHFQKRGSGIRRLRRSKVTTSKQVPLSEEDRADMALIEQMDKVPGTKLKPDGK